MAKFKVTVPLDATAIADIPKNQPLKVVGRDAKGRTVSTIVRLDSGKGSATLTFDEKPDSLRVFVGPDDVPDDQIDKLQTITANVPTRAAGADVTAPVLKITPFFWLWWRRWCRTYTITGQVVCADGSPVPGATVCAYDVDWFWWWRSTQQVGCATTAVDGTFTITFRWCCGWFPWWWWKLRRWELDVDIYERLVRVLPPEMKLKRIPVPDPVPDLSLFRNLLPPSASTSIPISSRAASQPDLVRLEALREPLLKHLPKLPNLDALRIWPWFPWAPWNDCAPDIIFRVTQDCGTAGEVIVKETAADTRWNVPTNLDVRLIANSKACCVRPPDPACDHTCLTINAVCETISTDDISGNPAAPPTTTPDGYAFPGGSGAGRDCPFGGNISVFGTGHCLNEVDYYEVESSFFDPVTSTWSAFDPVDLASLAPVGRSYFDWSTSPGHTIGVNFPPTVVDSRVVYETPLHFEQTHDPAAWHVTREWRTEGLDQLLTWATSAGVWADGLYRLQIRGYRLTATNTLEELTLDACDGASKSTLTIRIDNRLNPDPAHETGPDHPCIGVHSCVTEPDTDVVSVTIRRADGTTTPVPPCGSNNLTATDVVDVVFLAHDPDGHLGSYALDLQRGENVDASVLSHGPSAGPPPFGSSIPTADDPGPAYPGATDAKWRGGYLQITLPATEFPETCAYRIRLRAWKRTIVSCDNVHGNESHYMFTIIRA